MPVLYLVVVTLRLAPAAGGDPDGLADRLADALIAREETATVWLHADGRPSRAALDVEAATPAQAEATAAALVREVAAATGADATQVSTAVGGDRRRLLELDE